MPSRAEEKAGIVPNGPAREVDLLIRHGLVVTCDREDTVLEDGALAVAAAEIVAVGPSEVLSARFAAAETLDASGQMVIPGLVNTHTHSPMSLFRGLADHLPLEPWLQHMREASRKVMGPETARLGAELSYAEMIHSGTTTALDMYFYPEMLVEAARGVGLRLATGPVFMGTRGVDGISPEERVPRGREFLQQHRRDPMLIPCVSPHSAYSDPPEVLRQAQELAGEFDALLSTHAAETRQEVASVSAQHGCTPVVLFDRLGMLSPRTVLAHCVHLMPAEMDLLAERGASVAHCPLSNLKLGSGIAPVPEMVQAGVRVTLGTDGPASGNDLDLWTAIRVAAGLHRATHEDPTVTSGRQIVRMATIDAAEALGLGGRLGSLEAGKLADIVLIDLDRPHLVPMYDANSHLTYAVGRDDVCTVIVQGRIVLRDRRLLTLDEHETMAAVRRVARVLAAP